MGNLKKIIKKCTVRRLNNKFGKPSTAVRLMFQVGAPFQNSIEFENKTCKIGQYDGKLNKTEEIITTPTYMVTGNKPYVEAAKSDTVAAKHSNLTPKPTLLEAKQVGKQKTIPTTPTPTDSFINLVNSPHPLEKNGHKR